LSPLISVLLLLLALSVDRGGPFFSLTTSHRSLASVPVSFVSFAGLPVGFLFRGTTLPACIDRLVQRAQGAKFRGGSAAGYSRSRSALFGSGALLIA